MRIFFRTSKLERFFSSSRELRRAYGKDSGDRITLRLRELRTLDNLSEATRIPGRCHELKGERKGQLALDLKHPYRLVFEPTQPAPLKPDGGLDWTKVESVVIIEVVDYHV
jgi:proteic killer suppression protein